MAEKLTGDDLEQALADRGLPSEGTADDKRAAVEAHDAALHTPTESIPVAVAAPGLQPEGTHVWLSNPAVSDQPWACPADVVDYHLGRGWKRADAPAQNDTHLYDAPGA